MPAKRRARATSILQQIEADKEHHLAGALAPQTPLGSEYSPSPASSPPPTKRVSKHEAARSSSFISDLKTFRWIVRPSSSFKLMLIPIVLYCNWMFMEHFIKTHYSNPFRPMLFMSHRVPDSPDSDPRYQKGYLDGLFLVYHIVAWSFVRQSITLNIARPLGRYFGLKTEAKLDRFGEQAYAILYFGFFGAWGLRIMGQLPTWWYRTEQFWIGYPHWDMKPELKRYYLMQSAYWCQQLIVMLLQLEKPRKDYYELVAHHIVTIWMVGGSYILNVTYLGSAVFLSMDIPDAFFAFSKILNYIRWERAKVAAFFVFFWIWTYFRLYLNVTIIRSVWTEFDLAPNWAKKWQPDEGVWLVWWMRYQFFVPLCALLGLNLFWYVLIMRVAYRAVASEEVTDVRSDDEDGDEEPDNEKEE